MYRNATICANTFVKSFIHPTRASCSISSRWLLHALFNITWMKQNSHLHDSNLSFIPLDNKRYTKYYHPMLLTYSHQQPETCLKCCVLYRCSLPSCICEIKEEIEGWSLMSMVICFFGQDKEISKTEAKKNTRQISNIFQGKLKKRFQVVWLLKIFSTVCSLYRQNSNQSPSHISPFAFLVLLLLTRT